MNIVTATIVALDHFLPYGSDPDLHEFHVVIRFEGEARHARLRTERGLPLRLHHFQRAVVNSYVTTAEELIELFQPGKRLKIDALLIPTCRRLEEFGYHPMDIAVDPKNIVFLQSRTSPRCTLRLVESGMLA